MTGQSAEEPSNSERDEHELYQPTDRVGNDKYSVELDERRICENQRQRADKPDGDGHFACSGNGQKSEPCEQTSENTAGEERQRAGQCNRA